MAHEYTKNIICPYCDYEFDDSESNEHDDDHRQEIGCHNCEKEFFLEVHINVKYSTIKVCLGREHTFGRWKSSHGASVRNCLDCEKSEWK